MKSDSSKVMAVMAIRIKKKKKIKFKVIDFLIHWNMHTIFEALG